MKKEITFILSLVLILTVAACSAGATETETNVATLTETYEGALSVQAQLVVGTFKLEGTELAVNKEQASELLPLWQVVRSLISSDTTATAEVTAVVDQIQETMNAVQIEAIGDMQLTREDIFPLVQELGLMPDDVPGGDKFASREGVPGTGPGPGNPGQGGLGQIPNLEQQSERSGGTSIGDRSIQMLLYPLIELLDAKAQS